LIEIIASPNTDLRPILIFGQGQTQAKRGQTTLPLAYIAQQSKPIPNRRNLLSTPAFMSSFAANAIATGSNEEVFDLLCKELSRRLRDREGPEFVGAIRKLPVGLRAMAATFELDVSICLDDLGWHFGNWHDEELAEETAIGLEELGAAELAGYFREAYGHARKYWSELASDHWMEWYHGSALEEAVMPLNRAVYALLKERWSGIFSYWVEYARKYPEKIGAGNDASVLRGRTPPRPLGSKTASFDKDRHMQDVGGLAPCGGLARPPGADHPLIPAYDFRQTVLDSAMLASEIPHPPERHRKQRGRSVFARMRPGLYVAWIAVSLLALLNFAGIACDPDGSTHFCSWAIFGTVAIAAAIGLARDASSRFGKLAASVFALVLGGFYTDIVIIPGAEMAIHVLRYHVMT
jgi:hypothetical protein